MTDANTPDILTCPKCNADLNPVAVGEVEVHRCASCAGIWLDEGERLKLFKSKGAVEAVDIGSAELGHEKDAIQGGTCPRCNADLHHVTDHAQKHIGFEHCRACNGSFFDAGELTDLSHFSLSERIKSLLGR